MSVPCDHGTWDLGTKLHCIENEEMVMVITAATAAVPGFILPRPSERYTLPTSAFHSGGNEGSERGSDFSAVTQPVIEKVRGPV